ncbi:zeaxanthin epoxidase, chloroplastic-like [Vicia villosa]|uniref:zeaxanthin epoxidase, chloroplastic-like n=1 Tax=Vicia villosa TaxID=3911 RepID=UPI00273B2BE5|nr:zeaxanthin epoxidase, chloroplastic-like [Vicia villosa]
MASTLCYNSLNPSTASFSRTHFSIPVNKDFPLENSSSFHTYGRTRTRKQRKNVFLMHVKVKAAVAESTAPPSSSTQGEKKNLRVLVAGGGIGGLVFALAAKRKGFEVVVFEKDLSAVRGEGQYRGPIQIQSNALAALEAIDSDVADEVMRVGCITGDRINGLVDGVSGSWYVKFDTFTPAVERGLPVTRVISRMVLQGILARAVGEDIVMNASNVVSFVDDGNKVTVELENGQKYEGDLLVGADGIWSKVRTQLFGQTEAVYSGYTCYTGIADFVPADIDSVGYRVFLGHKQYFVSSDVGAGKMQWYAFHKEAPGGVDEPNRKKERLLKIFKGWCDNAVDLIVATDEEAILRRDIYDKIPTFKWGKGRVTLLGDSVHAMQPNMGQGGCMAIEDSYQLAWELDSAWEKSIKSGSPIEVDSSLRRYESERKIRVAVIHGMARMAALMASTYKAYLGVGLGPLEFLTNFRIPHPGRVGGRFFVDILMPSMLNWILGGNSSKLEGRPISCRLSDKANGQLRNWFEDDDALERAINGEWFLLPCGDDTSLSKPIRLTQNEMKPFIIGSAVQEDSAGSSITVSSPEVSPTHARIYYKDGAFFVTDMRSEHGTWIVDIEGKRYRVPPNYPARVRAFDVLVFGSDKVSFRVKVKSSAPSISTNEETPVLQEA